MSDPVLAVDDLHVEFTTASGTVQAVNGLTFRVHEGETFALLGESGSGKSVSANAMMRLLSTPPAHVSKGSVRLHGKDLLALDQWAHRRMNGVHISMVYQDALASLNPVFTVGWQIAEMFTVHRRFSRKDARARALELLERVGIPQPAARFDSYPHEFSGGMRQRIAIAIAIALNPSVLIADEPTTALDVTVQAQILELLKDIQRENGLALLLITHDMGVVAEVADRVGVMYAGKLVEAGPVTEVLSKPGHPYARGLLNATPDPAGKLAFTAIPGVPPHLHEVPIGCPFHPRCSWADDHCRSNEPQLESFAPKRWSACYHTEKVLTTPIQRPPVPRREISTTEPPVLRVENLHKHFISERGIIRRKRTVVRAVDGVSFNLRPQQTLGLVGESGCGKSTLTRALLRLIEPTAGHAHFRDSDLFAMRGGQVRLARRRLQVVFQDPYNSLDPRMTVLEIVSEPWQVHRSIRPREGARQRAISLLASVGLPESALDRYPHEFSGGQRQRIAIARALALEPEVLLCDEPTSALDVSVQAQLLALLSEIQEQYGLSILFISHDLSVIRSIAHEVAVMYLGKVVESGPTDEVFTNPAHPYTKSLLSAVPDPFGSTTERIILEGDLPSPANPPPGCRFSSRCWKADDRCRTEEPPLRQIEPAARVPAGAGSAPALVGDGSPTSAPGRDVACHYPEA